MKFAYHSKNRKSLNAANGTNYYLRDHRAIRVTTDANANVIGQQGHYPYGEQWYAASTTTKWFFTNYERDSESSNDYAQARYDINHLGRFSSPDLVAGAAEDPQTLNQYSYVYNDPVNMFDPNGLCPVIVMGFNDNYDPSDPNNATNPALVYANEIGADVVYPYAGHSTVGDLGSLLAQDMGAVNQAVQTTEAALQDAGSAAQNAGNSTSDVNLIAFSGGAQASASAVSDLGANGPNISSAVYLEPGTGLITGLVTGLPQGGSQAAIVRGKGLVNGILNAITKGHGIPVSHTDCSHSSNCLFQQLMTGSLSVSPTNTGPCANPQVFTPNGASPLAGGGGGFQTTEISIGYSTAIWSPIWGMAEGSGDAAWVLMIFNWNISFHIHGGIL